MSVLMKHGKLVLLTCLLLPAGSFPQDCNSNGLPDSLELSSSPGFDAIELIPLQPRVGTVGTGDLDGNGIPDLVVSHPEAGTLSVLEASGYRRLTLSNTQRSLNEPWFVLVTDLDADGDDDVAVTSLGSDELSILLNQDQAELQRAPVLRGLQGARSLTAADLDLDGNPDLVVNTDLGLWIARGKGAGEFERPENPPIIPSSFGTSLADLDGDGDLDLAVDDEVSKRIMLWTNPGDGVFTRPRGTRTRIYSAAVACPDLDADGDLDIIAGGQMDWLLRIRLPASNLLFAEEKCPPFLAMRELRLIDFDLDGDQDMAVTTQAGMQILWQDLPGEWLAKDTGAWIGNFRSPAAADYDGDGVLDLSFTSDRGAGVAWGRQPSAFFTPPKSTSELKYDTLRSLDVDGDSHLDLLAYAGVYWSGAKVFWNDGSLNLNEGAATYRTSGYVADIASGDEDGDGEMDIYSAGGTSDTQASVVEVLPGNGKGGLGTSRRIKEFGGRGPTKILNADLDGDGDLDLAVPCFDSDELWLLRNSGVGTYTGSVAAGMSGRLEGLKGSDLDGDGDMDLTAVVPGGTLHVMTNAGNASFSLGPQLSQIGPVAAYDLGDLDGDADQDLVLVSHPDRSVAFIFRNVGNLTFEEVTFVGFANMATHVTVADIDQDNRLDLVLPTDAPFPAPLPAPLKICWGSGNFRFFPCDALPLNGGGGEAFLVDFDNDGLDDLATSQRGSGALTIVRNAGARNFTGEFQLPVPPPLTECLGVNLSQGGNPELVVGSRQPGSVTVFPSPLGESPQRPFFRSFAAARPVDFGDYDQDGDADILLASIDGFLVLVNEGGRQFDHNGRLITPEDLDFKLSIDLDADGNLDLVASRHDREEMLILWGKQGALFPDPPTVVATRAVKYSVTPGHFDGDGLPDLALLDTSRQQLMIFHNTGRRSLTASTEYPWEYNVRWIQAADLDGDKLTDLILPDDAAGGLILLKSQPGGGFEQHQIRPDAPGPRSTSASRWNCASVDLDQDGDIDLAVFDAEIVVVLRNEGSFRFTSGRRFLSEGAELMTALDWDGDGNMDLASLTIASKLVILANQPEALTLDRDQNGVPDDCELTSFRRGDVNETGHLELTDVILILRTLFQGGDPLPCMGAADMDDSGEIDLTDAIHGLRFLYLGGPPPQPPYPGCGHDPTWNDLDCAMYGICPPR